MAQFKLRSALGSSAQADDGRILIVLNDDIPQTGLWSCVHCCAEDLVMEFVMLRTALVQSEESPLEDPWLMLPT